MAAAASSFMVGAGVASGRGPSPAFSFCKGAGRRVAGGGGWRVDGGGWRSGIGWRRERRRRVVVVVGGGVGGGWLAAGTHQAHLTCYGTPAMAQGRSACKRCIICTSHNQQPQTGNTGAQGPVTPLLVPPSPPHGRRSTHPRPNLFLMRTTPPHSHGNHTTPHTPAGYETGKVQTRPRWTWPHQGRPGRTCHTRPRTCCRC